MEPNNVAPAASVPATPETAPIAPRGMSDADAVSALRKQRDAPTEAAPVAAVIPAHEREESPPQGEDAGPEEAPGEAEASDEAGEPPVEPPRTWTKAEKEAFAALPREHQQAVAERERERDAHYQRGLQDAADKSKAAEAKEAAAEQARLQYERALPDLYARLQSQFQVDFADIKTRDDLAALRENDPVRWMAYKDARDQAMQVYHETQAVQERQAEETQKRWQDFVTAEDKKFLAAAPEYADNKKAPALYAAARATLTDLGFSQKELNDLWDGGRGISLRDHRVQLALRKAVLYDRAQAALKAAKPKPVPPVQRPGTAPAKGEAEAGNVAQLKTNLKRTGKTDDAVALLRASRKTA